MATCCHPLRGGGGGGLSHISKCLYDRVCGFNSSLISLTIDNSRTVQITFIFIDFHVCDFAFALKTQNAPCVSRFKRISFSDRFQFAF